MSASVRLARYATLAAVPATVTASAVADTYHASSNTPVSMTRHGSTSSTLAMQLFTAASMRFSMRGYAGGWGAWASFRRHWADAGPGADGHVRFFSDGSSDRVISTSAVADYTDFSGAEWVSSANADGWLTDGRRFLGFSVKDGNLTRTVNGFVEYEIDWDGSTLQFTIWNWAYNIDAPITMPANFQSGGGGAVPGLGGLAALACGAAGVRRRRQRVA